MTTRSGLAAGLPFVALAEEATVMRRAMVMS